MNISHLSGGKERFILAYGLGSINYIMAARKQRKGKYGKGPRQEIDPEGHTPRDTLSPSRPDL